MQATRLRLSEAKPIHSAPRARRPPTGSLQPAGLVNDLVELDLSSSAMAWTSIVANGTLPSSRSRLGFESASGKLYVFGGSTDAGQRRVGQGARFAGDRSESVIK